jgi:hypothetical protein
MQRQLAADLMFARRGPDYFVRARQRWQTDLEIVIASLHSLYVKSFALNIITTAEMTFLLISLEAFMNRINIGEARFMPYFAVAG